MDTKSISMGAFAFKGKGKKLRTDDYIVNNDEKRRLMIYNMLSGKANNKIKALQNSLNHKLFDEIELFINSTFSIYKQNVNKNANFSVCNLSLPTAILINGINTPDHDTLFHNLCERLKTNVTPHVARLHSDKCKDIKSAIKSLISQLVYDTNELNSEDSDEEVISITTMKCLLTFRVIADWYALINKNYSNDIRTPQKNIQHNLSNQKDTETKYSKFSPDIKTKILTIELENINIDDFSPLKRQLTVEEKSITPKKKRKNQIYDNNVIVTNKYNVDECNISLNNDKLIRTENKNTNNEVKPIVIIIEDFYSFHTAVIHDFFVICSEYLDRLPLILIVGTATNINSLHSILPHSVTSLLNIQQFQTPSASLQLSSVLDEILFKDDHLFKLDCKVFSFLLDFFLFYDFSIYSFLRGYNYAMLQHFQSNPASIICVDILDLENVVSNLNINQIIALKSLPSFKDYYEKSKSNIQEMFNDSQFIKDKILEFIKIIKDYNCNMLLILKCLHQFASVIPGCSLGKQLREIYAVVLYDDIGKSEDYLNTIKSLRLFSTSELLKNLVICKDILKNSNLVDMEFNDIHHSIQKFIEDLENLSVSKDTELSNEVINEEIKKKITRKISIHALKELLIESDPKKKILSKFENLRMNIVDYLDSIFIKYLICPKNLVLHEAFYFSNVKILSDRLNPAPRSILQRAFNRPYEYLKNKDLEYCEESISHLMPDICITYKLHTECGRYINLYDWLQAFTAVLTSDEHKDKATNKKNSIDPTIHARFIRCASELQLMGFIKPTKKKTDHVARLTWTGC